MAKKKGTRYNNGYSEEQKLQVLEVYKASGYNCAATSKQTGISRKSIRDWAVEYQVDAARKAELETIREKVAAQGAAAGVDYIKKASAIKQAALDRIELLVKTEKDLNKLVAVARLVNEMTGAQPPSGSTVNIFQQINNQLNIGNV